MKRMIAALCFMLAAAPIAFAQDKSAKPEMPKGAQMASDKAKGSAMDAEMSSKGEQAKKDRGAKQKAKEAKRACEKQAKEQKLKGSERRKFMKECAPK